MIEERVCELKTEERRVIDKEACESLVSDTTRAKVRGKQHSAHPSYLFIQKDIHAKAIPKPISAAEAREPEASRSGPEADVHRHSKRQVHCEGALSSWSSPHPPPLAAFTGVTCRSSRYRSSSPTCEGGVIEVGVTQNQKHSQSHKHESMTSSTC